MKTYDVIVIGAGSVGVPTTYFLSKSKLKVLCIEKLPSPGQGQNKAAIGGVRATHSDPAKIKICQKSLEIFSTWEQETGDDIEWKQGGYCFPVYREKEEKILKELLPIQKKYNLEIEWVPPEVIKEIVPGINPNNLRGGTYSPKDGHLSPLKAIHSFTYQSKKLGAEFLFNTEVKGFKLDKENKKIEKVITNKGDYSGGVYINCAGAYARDIGKMLNIDIPVYPDSHEAGISAPIKPLFSPLIVDLRPGKEGKTANFYFAQNKKGQIIFCYTPNPIFPGENRESTSEFMPIIARRLVELIPRFKNLLIRRIWRGLYPMTPDGVAIVGKSSEIENLYLGVGMCGQGFMMGPGVGANLSSLIINNKPLIDEKIFSLLSPNRDFYKSKELLK